MTTETTPVGADESSPAPDGCAVPISDDDILSLWRTVRPSAKQDRAMVYQTGPYDVDHPTFELRRLVELAMEHRHNSAISLKNEAYQREKGSHEE